MKLRFRLWKETQSRSNQPKNCHRKEILTDRNRRILARLANKSIRNLTAIARKHRFWATYSNFAANFEKGPPIIWNHNSGRHIPICINIRVNLKCYYFHTKTHACYGLNCIENGLQRRVELSNVIWRASFFSSTVILSETECIAGRLCSRCGTSNGRVCDILEMF